MKRLNIISLTATLLLWIFIFAYLWVAFLPREKKPENWYDSPDYEKTKEIHAYHAKGEFVSIELNGKWWFIREGKKCMIERR